MVKQILTFHPLPHLFKVNRMNFDRRKRIASGLLDRLPKKMRKLLSDKQFIRFFCIGGSCAILTLVLMYVLTTLLNVHYIISTIIVWFSTNFIGFYFNKKYTFKTHKSYFWRELYKYYGVMLSSCFLNVGLMYFFVSLLSIWYLLANVIVIGILFFYNFLMHKNWSFKK